MTSTMPAASRAAVSISRNSSRDALTPAEIQAISEEMDRRSALAHAELISGQVAFWEGNAADAVPSLERALAGYVAAGDPVGKAMAQLYLALALAALGHAAAAAALADECPILRANNTSPLASFARMLLGERPAESEPEPGKGTVEPRDDVLARLSPREREVADLVTQGLSDKEISDRLIISRRTAESHVANILSKLGFSSRVQVATCVTTETAI